ncbi:mitotic checkpoint regulator, MAD2B-interacting-domain-containing protein [Aspergillus pseudotamarii]|uniref:Mitotic checkpoint regulator, MAD2B-interacting-domain-containing protein n=1 Tax=Aspergillus pseudotamarii TaxID=132259 RepID=A0A5N6SE71_ASPPS|nr:mitotic checkpoint regulator, MAD2B-interacting-domain-containing protein [Aspergillus pseudotamarii]KAE8132010.1 mitotic checkpoint regulator, MAD2B-interacting-domain-containing protein [Aspergillus pseudotamarii]
MALVSYSDSEASDSEPETTKPTPQTTTTTKPTSTAAQKPKLVDSSNPRKIRVALDLKPEETNDNDDGPARKKAKIGGGGAFAGFNSFLPAPKRAAAPAAAEKKGVVGAGRKVFSLKTGAAPGFDRGLDEESRNEWAMEQAGSSTPGGAGDDDDDGTIPKAGSLKDGGDGGLQMKKPEEVKLKGNPMMFKPLSVARGTQKKKKVISSKPVEAAAEVSQGVKEPVSEQGKPAASTSVPVQPPAPKPKVSLFSLGSSESATSVGPGPQAHSATYEPLVYTADTDAPEAGPEVERELQVPAASSEPATTQTLDNIADDLNLSRSQRRHLFGRNADASKSRILHFNTDKEYIANQEMAHQTDMAAHQHNPVRAIAPGKHTLQQLVNAASSQREALEESFASGRRNKKEAGSRYGW